MQSRPTVTLFSSPASPAVTDDVISIAGQVIGVGAARRDLAPGVAAELALDGPAPDGVSDKLRKLLAPQGVDVFVHDGGPRRAKLFLADMDSTMIEQECIDELADYVGLKSEVSAITERAMRGEIAFEPALRERVALLRGLPVSVVDEIVEKRLTLMPGGRQAIATMRAKGTYTCLVSGGFTLFTSRIAAILGFHEHRSNELIVEDGKLAGRVEEPILGKEAKLSTLVELRERLKVEPSEVMAVGDGANDLAMLGEAGVGVAFRAKPAVAAAARARIDHGDLTGLLFLQGYAQEDFA